MEEDYLSHLETDIGKGIWYLQNSLRLLDFSHDLRLHEANVALDNLIQVNIGKRERGEQIKELQRGWLLPEFDELNRYEKELCDELRGALFIGLERAIDMPSCKRLVLSIDSRHVAGTPDFRTFIFDALVELETLLVAVESVTEPKADSPIVKSLSQPHLEIEVAKVLGQDMNRIWSKDEMSTEIMKDPTKKTSPSSVYATNTMKAHIRDKAKDRRSRKPDLASDDLVHRFLSDADTDPKLRRLIGEQQREMQNAKGVRIKGNVVKSRD